MDTSHIHVLLVHHDDDSQNIGFMKQDPGFDIWKSQDCFTTSSRQDHLTPHAISFICCTHGVLLWIRFDQWWWGWQDSNSQSWTTHLNTQTVMVLPQTRGMNTTQFHQKAMCICVCTQFIPEQFQYVARMFISLSKRAICYRLETLNFGIHIVIYSLQIEKNQYQNEHIFSKLANDIASNKMVCFI